MRHTWLFLLRNDIFCNSKPTNICFFLVLTKWINSITRTTQIKYEGRRISVANFSAWIFLRQGMWYTLCFLKTTAVLSHSTLSVRIIERVCKKNSGKIRSPTNIDGLCCNKSYKSIPNWFTGLLLRQKMIVGVKRCSL